MAIGNNMIPYIHTSFLNFKREEFGTTSKNIETSKKLLTQINHLEKVRDKLEGRAKEFLQGKTIGQIWSEVYGDYSQYINISHTILTKKSFYDKLDNNLNVIDRTKLNKNILKLLGNNVKENITINEIADLLIKQIPLNEKGIIDQKNLEKTLTKYFGKFTNTELQKVLSKRLKSIQKSGKLYKGIKEYLRSYYTTSAKNIGELAAELFEEEFNILFEKRNLLDVIENGNSKKQSYVNTVKNNLRKELQNKKATDISNLFGYGGEEFFAAIHNIGNSEIAIEVVGSKTEAEIRGFVSSNVYSLRKNQGASYSDLILIYKRKRVRVQSKNYQTVLQIFNSSEKEGKDILQQMHLLENEEFKTFLNRISTLPNNLGMDLNEIAYVLANEAWFSTAGNIRSENKTKDEPEVESMSFFQSYVDAALSTALINYLGVMYQESSLSKEVDLDNSNIFFLIDNKYFVPTYVIINNLITNLKEWKSGIEGVYLRINKNLPYRKNDAIQLLKNKEDAVQGEGGFLKNKNYQNSSLVSEGMKQGEKVLEDLKIASINLNISLKKLALSSYSFF